MSKLAILIITRNNIEKLKACVKSIRLWYRDTVNIIVADNGSEDGTSIWLQEQNNLSYVVFEKDEASLGKIMNVVMDNFDLGGNLLLLSPEYMVTQHSIINLCEAIEQEDTIGAISGIDHTYIGLNDKKYNEISDYCAKIVYSKEQNEYGFGINGNAVLLKKSVLDRIGPFNEEVCSMGAMMTDLALRLITADYKIMNCKTAIFYSFQKEKENLYVNDTDRRILFKKWKMHYFNIYPNGNLVQFLPEDKAIDVLEVGCDCGVNLLAIHNHNKRANLYGIEVNECAAEIAKHVANVKVLDIEKDTLDFGAQKFDYIIFGDVLEHLRDPEKVITDCKTLLKENGSVIASIPNLMHISVMEQLLHGRFTYTDTGLLDKTHIHLFTYYEIVDMVKRAGYLLDSMSGNRIEITENQRLLMNQLVALSNHVETFMYETFQYIVKMSKK